MAQHSRANSSGKDSAVHLHLKEKNHYFQDNNVNILTWEELWLLTHHIALADGESSSA